MTQDSNEVEKEIVKQELDNENIVIEINYNSFTPQELQQQVSELITTENIYSVANSIDAIKAVFYKKINTEKEAHKEEYLKNKGLEKEYKFVHPQEKDFKKLFSEFRKKKAEYRQKIELDFAKNLKIKTQTQVHNNHLLN